VDDKRNMVLAVVLTAVILFGWPVMIETFFPQYAADTPAAESTAANPNGTTTSGSLPIEAAGNTATGTTGTGTTGAVQGGAANTALPAQNGAPVSVADALKQGARVMIETPRVKGSINLVGARIDDLILTDHRMALDKKSPPVRLLAPSGTEKAYFGRFGWSGKGIKLPGDSSLWRANGAKLTPATPVTLTWDNEAGQIFTLTFSIDENYLISVKQSAVNNGANAIAVNPYALLSRVHDEDTADAADQDSFIIHNGPIGVFDGVADFDTDYETVDEAGTKGVKFDASGGWLGFTDKYWMAALIPAADSKVDAKFRAGDNNLYQAQLSANRAIDWGWFYWFEKPIFYLLKWLFGAVGNFGVAIILMTFIVRLVLFPLAQKQFASMAQMRAVQPKMKEIQARHKDDKQKQQQEIMALYKEEKVNPLAGCLPILLQIPIFFALYKVLMLSIEMRHQPFALWIKDLSAPDPLTPVNLFGLIPFDPPSFLAVGILPILMGITMHLHLHALDLGVYHGAICSRVTALLGGIQYFDHRAAKMALFQTSAAEGPDGQGCGGKGSRERTGQERRSGGMTARLNKVFSGPIHFLKSAPELKFLPDPTVPEIAFAGRSNVGKSSLINALTGRNGLARTSNTPGRTQELNFFDVGAPLLFRITDMPGYGYAKAPPKTVQKWRYLVNDYLRGRQVLKRTYLLIDARHGIKDRDEEVMTMLDKAAISYHIVMTKADKVKTAALEATTAKVEAGARKHPAAHPVMFVTSALIVNSFQRLRIAA